MPVVNPQNLKLYLSGGEGMPDNLHPENSLGGARSVAQMGDGLGNLFADVSYVDAFAGLTEYRCVYLRNEDPNVGGLLGGAVWIDTPTTSLDTEIDIGLDAAGMNGIAQIVADRETAPVDVVFSHPVGGWEDGQSWETGGDYLSLLASPLLEGDSVPIWIRRTVSPGAASMDVDFASLCFGGRSG